jgi:hypothetical protein
MLDRVRSVHQNFRLNDRDQTLGLANSSITAKILPKNVRLSKATNQFLELRNGYRARPQAFSCIARVDGHPVFSSILSTARHLAKRAPAS